MSLQDIAVIAIIVAGLVAFASSIKWLSRRGAKLPTKPWPLT